MTVEEIEIIVTAKVEEALKTFQKILPTIKQSINQVQEAFSKVDTKTMTNKLNQAVQFMKKKMQDFKKSSEKNEIEIKVNNKDAEKQITQLKKEIDSLQKKITGRELKLDIINNTLDKTKADTNQSVIKEMPEAGNKAIKQETYRRLDNNVNYTNLIKESDKLNNEIVKYNELLNSAKSKMTELGQQISQTGTTQSKLSSFFGIFKQKIEQVKPSISSISNSFKTLPKITQNITNNIKNMGTGVKNGLGHILKYAGALLSLKGIYSTLSNCANSWLSSQNEGAKQLSANMEYMKYAMGSALAPIIQFVTNLVYQLMKAIQSVIYALFKVNIFANASAKSYSNMAGSAKKAKEETKQLAGIHDEINNIQNNNSDNGSENGVGVTPSFDLSQIDNQMLGWINSIKENLSSLFEPIQNSWSKYGQPLLESMKYSFNSNIDMIKSIGKSFEEVWLNGTGEHTVSIILQILTSIFNICGNINTAFKNAWENNGGTEIIQNLWNGLNNILEIIKGIFQTFEEWTASESFQEFANSIIGICVTLSGWFELLTQKLGKIWENGGKQAFTSLLEFISKFITAIGSILQFLSPVIEFILNIVTPVISGIIQVIGYIIDALSGMLDFIIGVFTGDWEKAWEGIKEFFIGIWNALITIVTTIINAIWSIISTVFNVIATIFSTIWNGIKTVVSNIWNGIISIVTNVINGIKNTISNVLNAIKTVWNNIWTGIKNTVVNIWNGIWGCIKGVINAILGGIEGFVNGVIKGINFVLGGISKVANAVGSLIGLNPINLQLSTISLPRLAKGGVLTEATAVIAGEYSGASSNPEIVTPQNIMEETFERVMSRYQGNNNDRPINLSVYVGNTKLGQILLNDLRDMKRQTGNSLEALVGG